MFSTAIGPAKGFKAIHHHQSFGINGSSNPSIPTVIHIYGRKIASSKPNYHSAKITASAGSVGQDEAVTREDSKGAEDSRRLRRSADWKAAQTYQESGVIYEGKIEGSNGGGLLIRFRSLLGFLPFPLISPRHSQNEPQKSIQNIAKDLVGSSISVKVVQASEEGRKLIFSEKDVAWSKYAGEIKIGDIFEGKVSKVEDYGAFVDLLFPDGYYHVTGLVHVSEVSWDLVQDIRDILNAGDVVKVKVIEIKREKARLTLSIKQLEDDPLLESLDDIIPKEIEPESDTHSLSNNLNIEPLPGLESICKELLKEDGITEVKVGRRGLEKRVVSQDLELWLSNVPATDKQFILLARAGRQVQEVRMTSILDQDSIKQAVQRVLSRVS
ncbi:Polyribonucleotide nucleotidyltransferase [Zostera marina]|uniref:Polyribonucleotide nucleotidyltransferase n=1 Tax=Zostera marina TaxID=29655 RepID=A0A0K9NRY1_ZOSMR|nr:Polyribonucleotide nucleotidyltransferase [Zostera marina]